MSWMKTQYEVAHFIRRFLPHSAFATQAEGMGAVIRVMHTGLVTWRPNAGRELRLAWT
jgi:hypothetical protein